jgi:aryl-alcohol dehydrogenase-like predicted oxidoreductase
LKVPVLSLGSNNFGLQVSEDETIRMINKAIDLGINAIDTADLYTGGKSEEIIGKAVQGKREDVILASKVGLEGGASRRNIIAKVTKSLERLRTDYIDLYYIHAFDSDTPLDETMSTLNDLVKEGKLRHVACSNFSAVQMEQARKVCEAHGYEMFIADQPEYNMIQRKAESDVLPYCVKEKMGVFPYSPLMGGFLLGKYSRDKPAPEGTRGAINQGFFASFSEGNYAKLERLQSIANDAKISMLELAIGWLLKREGITSVIVGASRADQLSETAAIADRSLSDDIVRKVDSATA